MSLLWIDSCDNYTTALIPYKYETAHASIVIDSSGRYNNCIKQSNIYQGGKINFTKTINSSQTITVGCAYKINNWDTSYVDIIRLYDTSTCHVTLRLSSTGYLYITRNGTQIGSSYSASQMLEGRWYYIEFRAYIDDSNGWAEVRVNGDIWLTVTGDTRNGANAVVNSVMFGGDQGGTTYDIEARFDDIYITNDTYNAETTPCSGYLGDIRVESILPNAVGNSSEWTSTGGDNYTCVDDTSPDTNTYIYSTTSGVIDTYGFGNLATTTGDVLGVQINLLAAKANAGSRKIAPVIRYGGNDYIGSDKNISETYVYYNQIYETNISDYSEWVISDINTDSEFGVKIVY